MMKPVQQTTKKYFFGFFYLALFLVMLWRAFYGFDISDEAYHCAAAYRIALGEPIFSTCWAADQLAGIIYAPIIFLYKMIRGNMDGCILMLRVVFLLVSFACALWVFRRICGSIFSYRAFLCVTVFLSACRVLYGTFSYNTLLLLFSLLSFDCAYCAKKEKKTGYAVLCGLFYALAVQSYPTALVCMPVYFLFFLSSDDRAFRKKLLFGFMAGGVIVILLFLAFLSVQSSFSAFLNNFHHLFEEPEHGNPLMKIKPVAEFALIVLAIAGFTFVCQKLFFRNESRKEESVTTVILLIILAVLLLSFGLKRYRVPLDFSPYYLLLLPYPVLLLANRFERDDSVYLYLSGLVLSFSVSIATNNPPSLYIYPALFCILAAVLFFPRVIHSDKAIRIAKIEGLAAALVLLFSSLLPVYRDEGFSKLNVRMTNGPAMGILTTDTREKQYSETVELIKKYVPSDGNVLFAPLLPYGYLCTEAGIASPSLWRRDLSYPRFDDYYSENPEKLPRAVFVVDSHYGYQSGGETNEEYCDTFKKLFEEIPYQKLEIETGALYLFDFGEREAAQIISDKSQNRETEELRSQ